MGSDDSGAAAGPLRFALLGPVRAWRGERVLDLGAPRQRSVAAVLLLGRGRPVARDQLVRAVWGEPAPAYAVPQLQKYVSALRRVLEPERSPRSPSGVLNWSASGYVLDVGPDGIDAAAFERGVGRGRAARARGDAEGAAEELRAALALWHGPDAPALSDVTSGFLDTERDRLAELRAAALEERVQADLDLGRHQEVVPELMRLVGDFPLRERFAGLLMLALYRCGRQGDALGAYRRMRRGLREELGVDPGAEVQELHGRILASAPSLDLDLDRPGVTDSAHGPGAGVPDGDGPPHLSVARAIEGLHQLPMDIPEFIGREAELRELVGETADMGTDTDTGTGTGTGTGVIVAVIEGMAGVGKTRLAVRAAHQLVAQGHFADVQLWADLKGFSPDRPPADPAHVLEDFLRLLGVPGDLVPEQLDARAALYRDRLAGRRALVVLDDAADEEQVRPLLPGTGSCLLLITSRRVLGGLDGARTTRLAPFSPKEAAALIDRVTERERPGADPPDHPGVESPQVPGPDDALLRVAELCGHLPLAVALAGRRLRTRPSWSTADLARRLEADEGRLRQLAVGGRTVDAAFALSYESLPEPRRRAFRLLALHPGTDCTPESAAALLGTDRDTTEDLLEALLDEHLLQSFAHGRYRHHDLLRLYAHGRTHAEDTEAARTAATLRLAHWYCDAAEDARHRLEPWWTPDGCPRTAAHPRPAPPESAAAALEWLERERANLTAVTEETTRLGRYDCTRRLAAAAHSFLGLHAYGTDSLAGLHLGLDAARRSGDLARQARAVRDIGLVHDGLGRHDEAAEHQLHALALSEEAGDARGVAEARCGLGRAHAARGRYGESGEQHRLALAVFRETGDRHGEARSLAGLGLADWFTRGTHHRSAARHRRAFALFQEVGDVRGHALETSRLGMAHWVFGNHEECAAHHRRALTLFEEAGDRRGQAVARSGLALAEWHLGRPDEADAHYQRALAAFRDTCDRQGEAMVLQRLGYVHWVTGRYGRGEAELRDALALCAGTGNRNTEAWTLTSLGHLCLRLRRDDEAKDLLRDGLALSRRLGDRHCESSGLLGLALTALNQGDPAACGRHARDSLTLARAIANPHGEAWAMIGVGLALVHGGGEVGVRAGGGVDHIGSGQDAGEEWFRRAAAVAERVREPHTESMARHELGRAAAHLERPAEAERHLRAALALRRRIQDRHGEAETRTELAALLRDTGRPDASRAEEEAASALYSGIPLHDRVPLAPWPPGPRAGTASDRP
ncbi:AfsR/SARP family transcriptional regulator [Streptomyces alboflavus]|uniref:AfsR/SARP family transcriptional regulator n=1 Tax=Streptomyces alboflavus TaxID=67267 RepID=UPI000F656F8D|nr:BTAD domain-containing putative transcriptional regulator [Streptomyces alboflavus]